MKRSNPDSSLSPLKLWNSCILLLDGISEFAGAMVMLFYQIIDGRRCVTSLQYNGNYIHMYGRVFQKLNNLYFIVQCINDATTGALGQKPEIYNPMALHREQLVYRQLWAAMLQWA